MDEPAVPTSKSPVQLKSKQPSNEENNLRTHAPVEVIPVNYAIPESHTDAPILEIDLKSARGKDIQGHKEIKMKISKSVQIFESDPERKDGEKLGKDVELLRQSRDGQESAAAGSCGQGTLEARPSGHVNDQMPDPDNAGS